LKVLTEAVTVSNPQILENERPNTFLE